MRKMLRNDFRSLKIGTFYWKNYLLYCFTFQPNKILSFFGCLKLILRNDKMLTNQTLV